MKDKSVFLKGLILLIIINKIEGDGNFATRDPRCMQCYLKKINAFYIPLTPYGLHNDKESQKSGHNS